MIKKIALLIILFLLCACQNTEILWNPQSLSSDAKRWMQDANPQAEGVLFAEDLDLNGKPELYLLYGSGEYQNTLQVFDWNGELTNMGEITMGQPADDVWWIACTYNEDEAYLTIDSRGYACSADGNSSYTQHNITVEQGQLCSLDVLISEIPGVAVTYVIDGTLITDQKEYRNAMEDYLLQDGQTDVLSPVAFSLSTGDFEKAALSAMQNWENRYE